MIGIFFIVIGMFTSMLALSLQDFENEEEGKRVRRMFMLFGIGLFLIGLFFVTFTW